MITSTFCWAVSCFRFRPRRPRTLDVGSGNRRFQKRRQEAHVREQGPSLGFPFPCQNLHRIQQEIQGRKLPERQALLAGWEMRPKQRQLSEPHLVSPVWPPCHRGWAPSARICLLCFTVAEPGTGQKPWATSTQPPAALQVGRRHTAYKRPAPLPLRAPLQPTCPAPALRVSVRIKLQPSSYMASFCLLAHPLLAAFSPTALPTLLLAFPALAFQ